MTESHHRPAPAGPYRPFIVVGAIFLTVAGVVAVSKLRTPQERVPWRSDFEAAREEARRLNRPMLLYFTAEWCGPCQRMRRTVWTDPNVAEALSGHIAVRIDIDRDPALARRFNAAGSVPWIFLLDSSGQILRSVDRAMEAGEFMEWLKR